MNLTPEAITAIVVGVTAFLSAIGKILYDRYFKEDLDLLEAGEPTRPLLEKPNMNRVYELLREYVTLKACESKHEGWCDKFDMIRDEIKHNRELYMDQHKLLVDDLRDFRRFIETMIAQQGGPK